MAATKTPEQAIAKRNAAAARVARLEDQLYTAREALRTAECKAWDSIGPNDRIRLGDEWEYRPGLAD